MKGKDYTYSVAIRTLGKAGNKYQILLNSLLSQTLAPDKIVVYIAKGYEIPNETINSEKYVFVKKGMVSQRALEYNEIESDYILFLDDDVYLPPDAVERLFDALLSQRADVVAPDVFHNANRPLATKLMMAVSGRMLPRLDDRKWAYKVLKNAGYSYNSNPSQSIYESQTNAGPCFLCSKENFLKINFKDELWLEDCSYALGDDQVMFYKMHCCGLKQLTLFNTGIVHMDAGTTLQSLEKEKALVYSDFRFKTIFWHRFIFKPEKNPHVKLCSIISIIYTFAFTLIISLIKFRFDIFKLKYNAIKDGINYIYSEEYKKIPLI